MKKYPLATWLLYRIEDVWYVYVQELKRIFSDKGVMLIFFVAVLAYPILYPFIYYHEAIVDLPIAVVDMNASHYSREYIRMIDATREVAVSYKCTNMNEAESLYHERKIHGIIYIPSDFEKNILTAGAQATVSVYCDMSSFLYYKNVLQASNFVMLDQHVKIQTQRYELLGNDKAMAQTLAQPLRYETVMLYNPAGGYPSYLLPSVLILILYQTMFFGICMLAGIAREKNGELYYIEGRKFERSTFRLVFGRAFAYFSIYFGLSVYALLLVPRLFDLPHIGNPLDIMRFTVPFLLATAFFSMTVSVFIRERETAMVTLLFSSIVLLFLSGASWPSSNLPQFWADFARLFPSTYAINGYIHINSCGASLWETRHEYYVLWLQTGIYFLTAVGFYAFSGWYYEKTANLEEHINSKIDKIAENQIVKSKRAE
ncbi:MAG: ABC transporter permease [Paludibacteraceae bacterium]|nr:ABC transporter permease [Paludibacteraceae bacterium]